MKKDIVKNAVICLSHLKIEDTTFEIARDIIIEEYEDLKERIDKAIEHINKTPLQKGTEMYRIELLEILQGSVNEC